MFCKYCGKELDNDATFCPKCGKRINEASGLSSRAPVKGISFEWLNGKADGIFIIMVVVMVFLCFAMYRGTFIPGYYPHPEKVILRSGFAGSFDSLLKISDDEKEANVFILQYWNLFTRLEKQIKKIEQEYEIDDYGYFFKEIFDEIDYDKIEQFYGALKLCLWISMFCFVMAGVFVLLFVVEIFDPTARRGKIARIYRGFTVFFILGLAALYVFNVLMGRFMEGLSEIANYVGFDDIDKSDFGVTTMYVVSAVIAFVSWIFLTRKYEDNAPTFSYEDLYEEAD